MTPSRARSVPLTTQRDALAVLHGRLVEEYGEPRPQDRLPVLDEIVLTILSQNTNDTNRDRAWERLRGRFPDWETVAEAPLDEVEEAISVGGLHHVKARRIRDLLRQVRTETGGFDLQHLDELETDAARSALKRYRGLGEKSINCVLLFSLGKPAFPVDTHVFRVLRRLDAHRCRDLSRANVELQEAVPAEISYPLHMNVIRHGREVCAARRPACYRCSVVDLCAYEEKDLEAR